MGRTLGAGQAKAASLPDYASHWVAAQAYPMLVMHRGTNAVGLLVCDLTTTDIARLDFYEGGFGYTLRSVSVETANGAQQAQVYFPDHPLAKGDVWNLADWVADWGEMTLCAAHEAMGYFGQITADELTRRFETIRLRAASYQSGQAEVGRKALTNRRDVTVLAQRTPYSNFYTLQEFDLHHRRFDGGVSDQMERAAFIGFDAAIVLPYDPKRDCVLLIEQFRVGAYARGENQPWLLEAVAGHIDLGETPEQAAMREAQEEAGLQLQKLIPINQAYPSPGASTEYFHIFLGLCDLDGAGGTTAGLHSEQEDIHSHILTFDAAMELAAGKGPYRGGANVLPLITAIYWLAINRDRLRKDA